jgi:hypothetical protein
MTQSFSPIPDGFSFDQLKDMMSEAIPEEVAHKCELEDSQCSVCDDPDCDGEHDGPFGSQSLTESQVIDIADKCLTEATEQCDDPIVHKVIMCMIINNMYQWHKRVAQSNDSHSWSRDAGKFQAIMNILDTISVSDDDFTCEL